jgi:hypothetical protein
MKKKIFLPLLFSLVLLSGFQATAQPALPEVSVRFANPQYDCDSQKYCLDVEFLANTQNQWLFGINVRFFYDDNVLEYLYMGDFQAGYDSPSLPQIETYSDPESIAFFGFGGPVEWFNGYVQLEDSIPTFLSTTDTAWTKLFNVCFHVDDPNSIGISSFCPSIVWDLQEDPPENGIGGGYNEGDDGVAITVVTTYPNSAPTTEIVEQFNWMYAATNISVGHPERIDCIKTTCGHDIPLSNWSLFLAIGLMLIASVFIYRRRISG